MAQFARLGEVGELLTETIRRATGATVLLSAPPDEREQPEPQVVVTLLWAHHATELRNLTPERSPTGATDLRDPVLWATYLVTTDGRLDREAHDLLGQVLGHFWKNPIMAGPHDTAADKSSVQVLIEELDATLVTQLFQAVGVPLRPCTLLKVGPIQLMLEDSSE